MPQERKSEGRKRVGKVWKTADAKNLKESENFPKSQAPKLEKFGKMIRRSESLQGMQNSENRKQLLRDSWKYWERRDEKSDK